MTTQRLKKILTILFIITFVLILLLSYSFEQGTFMLNKTSFKDTLRFEILKSLLQLLVIIIIGGIISTLFKSTEAHREQSKIKSETWKNCLKRISTNYQTVKLVRRTLTAGGLTAKYGAAPALITKDQLDLYIEQMGILNKAQLEIEGVRTEAKFLPDFLSLSSISDSLSKSEDYIRLILKEYEKHLPALKNNEPVYFSSLERLNEFTTSTKVPSFQFTHEKGHTDYRFKTHFCETFDEILIVFKQAFQ